MTRWPCVGSGAATLSGGPKSSGLRTPEEAFISGYGLTTLSVEGYGSVKLIGYGANEFDTDDLVFG
mgnify:CR=1 FL=1